MNRNISNISHAAWITASVFFLSWFAVAGLLLLDGEESPPIRFAFAVCGSMGLFAGLRGGLFLFPVRGFRWLERKNLGCFFAILSCLSFVAAVLAPVFLQAQSKADLSRVTSELKQEGLPGETHHRMLAVASNLSR